MREDELNAAERAERYERDVWLWARVVAEQSAEGQLLRRATDAAVARQQPD